MGRYTITHPALCDRDRDCPIPIIDSHISLRTEFNDINDNGVILGNSSSAGEKSILWTEDKGTIAYIGGIENAETYCFTINNLNQAVGWRGNESFIWDQDDGLVNLNTFLP